MDSKLVLVHKCCKRTRCPTIRLASARPAQLTWSLTCVCLAAVVNQKNHRHSSIQKPKLLQGVMASVAACTARLIDVYCCIDVSVVYRPENGCKMNDKIHYVADAFSMSLHAVSWRFQSGSTPCHHCALHLLHLRSTLGSCPHTLPSPAAAAACLASPSATTRHT